MQAKFISEDNFLLPPGADEYCTMVLLLSTEELTGRRGIPPISRIR